MAIGNLLGTRMALNEVIAYIALGAQKATLAPRSFTIATFALCGFANLGSIGMQIGGIGALVPERRNDLAKLGVRAMLAGTMANLISASIAGMFLGNMEPEQPAERALAACGKTHPGGRPGIYPRHKANQISVASAPVVCFRKISPEQSSPSATCRRSL